MTIVAPGFGGSRSPTGQVWLGTGAVGVAPAAQALGSQGARPIVDEFGEATAEELDEPADVVGVVVAGCVDDVEVWAADGEVTAKSVPVTTVTSAPLLTAPGSYDMTTAPVNERITRSAAASTAAERDP